MFMHKRLFRKTPFLPALLIFCLVSASFLRAQESGLTKEAQQAVTSGLVAAKLGDWDSAIKHFNQARELAPDAPGILFNLALACDKKGKKELATMALYKAYLIAAPGAANTQKVQARIKELAALVDRELRILIRATEGGIDNIPEETIGYSWDDSAKKNKDRVFFFLTAYKTVARAQMDLGDFAAALKTLAKAKEAGRRDESTLSSLSGGIDGIVSMQAEAGDIEAALKTAAEAKTDGYSYCAIVRAQLKNGDIAGAKNTAALIIADEAYKSRAYVYISEAEFRAGGMRVDKDAAYNKTIKLITKPLFLVSLYLRIANLQLKKGDAQAALNTLAEAAKSAKRIKKDDASVSYTYYELAEAQLKAGDFESALKSVAQAEAINAKLVEPYKYHLEYWGDWITAEIKAKRGDLKGANQLIASIKQEQTRRITDKSFTGVTYYLSSSAYGNIARIQNILGDSLAAAETIAQGNKGIIQTAYKYGVPDKLSSEDLDYLRIADGLGKDVEKQKRVYLTDYYYPLLSGVTDLRVLAQSLENIKDEQGQDVEGPDAAVDRLRETMVFLSSAFKKMRSIDEPWELPWF
jgi:tetratricopeptide (TPR) repeat protein